MSELAHHAMSKHQIAGDAQEWEPAFNAILDTSKLRMKLYNVYLVLLDVLSALMREELA